ncbi:MAG: hypothetical protein AAB562_03940 [Patescibacteria group bacterium]
MRRNPLSPFIILTLALAALPLMALGAPPAAGSLIKLPDDGNPQTTIDAAVYYYGVDGKRYVFPNDRTYFTWYENFSSVQTVSAAELAAIQIGGNVTYRPGFKMVKIQTDPKVYAVAKGGTLRWVQTEGVAIALYGASWNQKIDDVPDAFFVNYATGATIASASDYSPAAALAGSPDIGADKGLASPAPPGPPAAATVEYTGSGFAPQNVTIAIGGAVTWINKTGSLWIASNPHPAHTDLPGLSSGIINTNGAYSFTFNQAGAWGYHHHLNASFGGTVTVSQ